MMVFGSLVEEYSIAFSLYMAEKITGVLPSNNYKNIRLFAHDNEFAFTASERGKHAKTAFLLADKEKQAQATGWIRARIKKAKIKQGGGYDHFRIEEFRDYLDELLVRERGGTRIHIRTVWPFPLIKK